MSLNHAPSPFDRFFADFEPALAPRLVAARPAVDLVAYPDRIELLADLPGLSRKDVEVQFEDGRLSIRGERSFDVPDDAHVLRRERAATRFERSFALGENIDVDGIQATMRDGVLRITLPKSERARPRQIEVSVN